MSRSNVPSRKPGARAGFTLLELVVSVGISMVIFLAVLGAYFYLARNLTRLANTQSLEVANRRTIYLFTRDVSTAKQITATATQIKLLVLVPPADPSYQPPGNANYPVCKTVVFNYSNGTLTRTATPPSTIAPEDVSDSTDPRAQLLSGLTNFNFNFYGADGSLLVLPAIGYPIKAVDFVYSTSTGVAANGTQSNYSAVSPRIILRNKPYLE